MTPTRRWISSGPSASQTSANVNGLATLMIVNATSASPTKWTRPSTDDADAVERRRRRGERRVDVRDRSDPDVAISPVRFVDERDDVLLRRQPAGRDVARLLLAGRGIPRAPEMIDRRRPRRGGLRRVAASSGRSYERLIPIVIRAT